MGTFLQAIISIVFIYLILALLTSELQEYLATISESRAKRLKQSIRQMLGEGSLESVGRGKNKFKVFSPSYQQDNVEIPGTWEQQYSLQDELSIRSNQGLQKNLGTTDIPASEDNACKSWIKERERVISKVDNLNYVFVEGDKEYIWIETTKNRNQEFSAGEVIIDLQKPDQGFVKNASRLSVISNKPSLGAGSLAWLDESNFLNPVIDQRNTQQEADGSRIIWIDHQTRQEVNPDLANSERASKCHVYVSPVDIPTESKLWIQGQEIGLIEESDLKYIQDQAFVWVNTTNHQILDPGLIIIDPENSEVASDKQVCVNKYSVYQLVMPLTRDTRYYVNHHNQIRPPLEVNSLTEKIYQHPKIVALNQSAISWVSFFAFSSFPLRWKWWLVHVLNLLSIFLVILLGLNLLGHNILNLQWSILLGLLVILRLICFRQVSSIPSNSGITRTSYGPSYIDDSNLFVDVLIDVLQKESDTHFSLNNNGEVEKCLETLPFYTPAQSILLERIKMSSIENLDAFKLDLNKLYEEVQKRSSGVYKRNAKGLSILVGLLIASVANADTFNMLTHLTKPDNEFSQDLMRKLIADPSLSQCEPGNKDCLDEAKRAKLQALINDQSALPLGWSFNALFDLKRQKSALENGLKLITAERNKKATEIDDKEKLVASLNDLCPEGTTQEKCLQIYADKYYKSVHANNPSLIDKEFLALLQSSNEKNSDSIQKQRSTQLGQEIAKLKQIFLQEDARRKDQERDLGAQLSVIEKQIKNIEEGRATNTPIPKDSQAVITRLNQFSASSTSEISHNVSRQGGWPRVLFGWLITAVALSMGAPFWFDLLSRVMNVRNAAKMPVSATPDPATSQPSPQASTPPNQATNQKSS
jgi:hypothetical protein